MKKQYCDACGKLSKLVYLSNTGSFCKKCNDYKNSCEDWGV